MAQEELIKVTFERFDFSDPQDQTIFFSATKTTSEAYVKDFKVRPRLVLWYTEDTLNQLAVLIISRGGIINPMEHNL